MNKNMLNNCILIYNMTIQYNIITKYYKKMTAYYDVLHLASQGLTVSCNCKVI